jgi:hypothetical protein
LISQVIAAGVVMAISLALLARVNFIVASIVTSFLYLVVMAALVLTMCGGPIGIRDRFLVALKEQ